MFLEIKNLNLGYTSPLVEGINAGLDVADICLLIGNNGVGKTTLIKTILNQIPALAGDIFIEGHKIRSFSKNELAKKIAIVFSKADIPASYKVSDLIALGKYVHYPYYFELSAQDKKEVHNVIKQLGLEPYQNLHLSQLSDGNLQKAFIGRALTQNSPFIILDEPTTHLDEENKIAILQLLRHLAKKQQKIILFSSHDWRLAKEFADKTWYIKNKDLQAGITEDVLSAHPELVHPQLFRFEDQFVSPRIEAPKLDAEMLYSFLQKNSAKDLSGYLFRFSDGIWEISTENLVLQAINYKEISNILNKI